MLPALLATQLWYVKSSPLFGTLSGYLDRRYNQDV